MEVQTVNRIKKFIPVICILLTITICATIAVSAANDTDDTIKDNNIAEYSLGDIDKDGKLTIIDAMYIQNAIAKKDDYTLNEYQTIRGDADNNGEIDINDVTYIQRCANLKEKTNKHTCENHCFEDKIHQGKQLNIGETIAVKYTEYQDGYQAEQHAKCSVCGADLSLLAYEYNKGKPENEQICTTEYIITIHRKECDKKAYGIGFTYYKETTIPVVCTSYKPAEPVYENIPYKECKICGRIEVQN